MCVSVGESGRRGGSGDGEVQEEGGGGERWRGRREGAEGVREERWGVRGRGGGRRDGKGKGGGEGTHFIFSECAQRVNCTHVVLCMCSLPQDSTTILHFMPTRYRACDLDVVHKYVAILKNVAMFV